jgi:dTDP-4-dehydrorhamnose 3,5-epimerase
MSEKLDNVRLLKGDRPVEGVKVIRQRCIPDERGTILHMLKASDPHFERFGEIYFSTIYKDVVKGWHKHREMTLNYACVFGRIKIAVYDDRAGSPSEGSLMEIHLGPESHSLVIIPPDTWNGFKGLTDPYAVVANCCTHEHDPARSSRLDPFQNDIPYDWALRNH